MTEPSPDSLVPRVFISSTSEDLRAHREAAKEAALAAQMLPRMMEYFTAAGDRPPLDRCLAEVSGCDLLVAIVAHRYGWVPDDQPAGPGSSITRLEVERAVADGMEVLAFVVDDKHPWPEELREESGLLAAIRAGTATAEHLAQVQQNVERLRRFKVWLDARGVRAAFNTPEHLRRLVSEALHDWQIRHRPRAAPGPAEPPSPASPTRYLAWLRDQTSYIDIRGLQVGSGRAPRFPIEELYIPLTTSAAWQARAEEEPAGQSPQRMGEGMGERMGEGGRPRVDLRTALHNERLVIVGDPGAGKTTLLRRIACLACRAVMEGDASLVREHLPHAVDPRVFSKARPASRRRQPGPTPRDGPRPDAQSTNCDSWSCAATIVLRSEEQVAGVSTCELTTVLKRVWSIPSSGTCWRKDCAADASPR